jgi:hypothetical protein
MRRYLETHNIAPIDLAPLVNHLPKNERYSAATKIFLDVLRTEQPPAPAVWKRHASNEYPLRSQEDHQKVYKDASFAAEVLKETARLLRDDRESYPGWLVCPREERRHPRFGYGWAIFKPAVLAHINPPELAEILNEFLWHYTISFTDLPLMFRDALASIMNESSPPIERGARLKFAVALIRDARVEGNDGNFEKWSAIVDTEADADAPERLEAQYQRCLRLRDQLDLSGLGKSLNALDSESPLWRLRQRLTSLARTDGISRLNGRPMICGSIQLATRPRTRLVLVLPKDSLPNGSVERRCDLTGLRILIAS